MLFCPSCETEKAPSEFHRNKKRKTGRACYCKACCSRKAKDRAKTPQAQAYKKAYYEKNKEVILARAKERWVERKDQYDVARKKWAEDNRDKMLSYYQNRGAQHRAFLDSQKEGKPCLDCGKSFPPYVMEYDHVKGEKRFNLGKMANHARERVLEELEKCELVCCACHRVRSHNRRQESKTPRLIAYNTWIREVKDNPCLDCGDVLPHSAMDFDHVRGKKVAGIAQMWSWGREKVIAEIAKCELVCANCHRERTISRMRGQVA